MSILNRASDGLHNVLIVLYKCVLNEGTMAKEKLLAVCAPPSVCDGDMARKTLHRWTELGLFEEREDSIAISNDLPRRCRDKKQGLLTLPQTLRQLVLASNNNERLWEAEESRSADFTRALSWMLAQDVYDTEFVGFEEAWDRVKRQFNDSDSPKLITTNVRWSGFKAWAPYLGFGWISKYPRSPAFQIDPTLAVRDCLAQVFDQQKELDHKDFFSRLANLLPVVDGGAYRCQIEEKISTTAWTAPSAEQVSTSLSRALERLNASGQLVLESRADADKRTLIGHNQSPSRTVSHFVWMGRTS